MVLVLVLLKVGNGRGNRVIEDHVMCLMCRRKRWGLLKRYMFSLTKLNTSIIERYDYKKYVWKTMKPF